MTLNDNEMRRPPNGLVLLPGGRSSDLSEIDFSHLDAKALASLVRHVADLLDAKAQTGDVVTATSVAESITSAVRFKGAVVDANSVADVAARVYDATVAKGHSIKLPREVFLMCARAFPNIEAEKAVDASGQIVGFTENAVNRATKAYGVYQIRPAISNTLRARYGLGLITDHFASQLVYLLFLTDEHYRMLVRENLLADHLERTVTQLYLMHFLGAPTGLIVLRAPAQKKAFELAGPSVVSANPSLFKGVQTVGDLALRVTQLLRVGSQS